MTLTGHEAGTSADQEGRLWSDVLGLTGASTGTLLGSHGHELVKGPARCALAVAAVMSVWMKPGAMALAVTLNRPSSMAEGLREARTCPPLAAGVVRLATVAEGRRTGQVHDSAPTRLHVWRGQRTGTRKPPQVRVHDGVPSSTGHLVQHAVADDPRVIDQGRCGGTGTPLCDAVDRRARPLRPRRPRCGAYCQSAPTAAWI